MYLFHFSGTLFFMEALMLFQFSKTLFSMEMLKLFHFSETFLFSWSYAAVAVCSSRGYQSENGLAGNPP
jgi:hypothetical protein